MSAPSKAVCVLVDTRDDWRGIRALRDDEPLPKAAWRRYTNADGYVRIRWHVGPDQYVEAYEHRINAGRPAADLHVHHKNRVRNDNRPRNLVVLTAVEHSSLHAREDAAKHAAALAARGGYKSQEAREKAERAITRRADIETRSLRMRELYEDDWSTTEIGDLFGIDSSNVSRHLRRVGTTMRAFSRWNR